MNAPRSGCPINLTLKALGDRWSLIVIRDLMFGNRRHFRELLTRSEERIASNILADRLRRLEKAGLVSVATIRASITESFLCGRRKRPQYLGYLTSFSYALRSDVTAKIVPHQSGSGKLKAHS
jgi:HxlR-like helix-turn-helix protein